MYWYCYGNCALCTLAVPVLSFRRGENERDVFNEKPSKEEQLAATQVGVGWEYQICGHWDAAVM